MSRLAAVQWVGGALIALSIGALALRVQEADGRVAGLKEQVALDRADFDAERARLVAAAKLQADFHECESRRLEDALAERDKRLDACSRQEAQLRADLDVARARLELEQLNAKQAAIRIGALEERASGAEKVRDALDAELLAAHDRLEKAYKDILEMEAQLVEVSRQKNRLEDEYRMPRLPDRPPVINGVVLGVSNKVNLVLISVGSRERVAVGDSFYVLRGDQYISKLVVDKVEDGWAACKELTDFRKDEIQQGDKVTTHAFD